MGTWIVLPLRDGQPQDPIGVFSEVNAARKEFFGRAEAHQAHISQSGIHASNGRGFELWLIQGGTIDHRYSKMGSEVRNG